jgi:Copper transport outer membrane protein, MctB
LIDFRYHLVSIVAVFLALAIGIVLGSTELQGGTLSLLNSTSNSLRSQLTAADTERDAAAAQASAAASFVQTSESLLLGDGHLLSGHKLLLITEPGAPSSVVEGVKKAAIIAGATVTGQVALQPSFNDLSGATQSTLSSINGSIASSDGTTLTPGSDSQTTYQEQAAQLIAGATLEAKTQGQQGQSGEPTQAAPPTPSVQPTPSGQVTSDAGAQTLLKGYAQAGFITASGTPTERADLAVIVTPGSVPADGASDPANEVLVAIAQAFASASAVTVIAGDSAHSGQPGSAISVVRSSSVSSQVSTIDNADTTQGQITVMQAIAMQLAGGKPSSYGMSGASSVSPDPVPTPAVTATPSTPPTAGQHTTGQHTGNGGKQVKKK